MDNVLFNLSKEQIAEYRAKYPGNKSIATMLDGIEAAQAKAQAEAQARFEADMAAEQIKENFVKAVDNLLVVKQFKSGKETITTGLPLDWPPDVYSIYLTRQTVEVATGPEEQVEVTKPDGTKVVETRQPTTKVTKIVAELNKGFQTGRTATATGDKTAITSKRAVTVYKREGLANKPIGNFPSASKACEYLKINPAGDSATRVLGREGYILDAYTGTDFTK